jgi:hypothetical protein
MTSTGWLWQVLDWFSFPVLAVVLGILISRRLYREYPFFFLYLLVTETATLVRFAVLLFIPHSYFYTYWISDVIIALLNVLAVYELFVRRIFPQFYRVSLYRYLFPALAALAVLFGGLAALNPKNLGVLALEDRILDAVVVGTLMFFGLLMLVIGRQWTRQDFGIAFGFAIWSAAFLISTTVWMRSHFEFFSAQIPVIAYNIASLIWLYSFWSPEKTPGTPQTITPELVSEARAWQSALKNWISKKG